MFWRKKSVEEKRESQEKKDVALEKNKEAARKLEKTLKRLGPFKEVSDLLGGAS